MLPAGQKREKRFSIRAGDVVHDMKINGYAPAVCSALKTREFLRSNNLRLVDRTGPESGLSTTVTYTYEFIDTPDLSSSPGRPSRDEAWKRLRGLLKDVFSELGGGEAYLRAERSSFNKPRERE